MQPSSNAASPLATLSPAYFSVVMATGIVSIGAWRLGYTWLAYGLFALNVVVFALLWVLYVLRLVRYRQRFFADLCDHLKGVGFFTMVAGTGVLGSQCVLLFEHIAAAVALWVLAIVMWVLLTFSIFAVFTVKEHKPSLDKGINGGWLLAVVATQAIAALSALLAAHVGEAYQLQLNFLALSMWLWGGMLYIWLMSLIFYRYNFFELHPQDLSPPYWINMGAMAISTLVGALLGINAMDAPFLQTLEPFIKGFTVFYWATGTWWIPMLVVLGFWRYVYKRSPLSFDPLYWGGVFPLGMWAASTFEMAELFGLHFLRPLTDLMFWVAVTAWVVVCCGQLRAMWRAWRRQASRLAG